MNARLVTAAVLALLLLILAREPLPGLVDAAELVRAAGQVAQALRGA